MVQRKMLIFKSNAPTLLKLGEGLDHMYTKGLNFLLQLCNVLMEYDDGQKCRP